MIARVTNYSATVATPTVTDRNLDSEYEPLIERVCLNWHDLDEISRQMRLIMKSGEYPLVVVFTPKKARSN
jgi:hypothetical protein